MVQPRVLSFMIHRASPEPVLSSVAGSLITNVKSGGKEGVLHEEQMQSVVHQYCQTHPSHGPPCPELGSVHKAK